MTLYADGTWTNYGGTTENGYDSSWPGVNTHPQDENRGYGVSWAFGRVNSANTVLGGKFTEMKTYINTERSRRAQAGYNFSTRYSVGNTITADDYNTLRAALSVSGFGPYDFYSDGTKSVYSHGGVGAPAVPAAVGATATITAAHLNDLMGNLETAAAVCLCNCNYCTCNCNYCTCNCNYSCTCNCNYSDRRLKTSIKYLGTYKGIKVYSFQYIDNHTKTYAGVMAQDLLGTKYQSALSRDINGYYMVDYSQLPIFMKEI